MQSDQCTRDRIRTLGITRWCVHTHRLPPFSDRLLRIAVLPPPGPRLCLMSVYPSRRLRSTRAEIGDDTSIAAYADIRAVEKTPQADHVAFGRVDAPDGFQIMAYDVQPWKAYNPGENRSRSRYRRPKAMRSSPYGMLGPRCSRRPVRCGRATCGACQRAGQRVVASGDNCFAGSRVKSCLASLRCISKASTYASTIGLTASIASRARDARDR
jgi:hypothetical protein